MIEFINDTHIVGVGKGVYVEKLIDRNGVEYVPVVRCKDCTYYVISRLKRDGTADKRYKPSVCVRGEYAKWRRENWYCADGERRSEDG